MTPSLRLAAVFSAALAAMACETSTEPSNPGGGVTALQVTDVRVGTGTEATVGRTLDVRYTGWLYDTSRADNKGFQFDAGTFTFVLGAGTVIRGWDQGLAGMKVGGQRRLVIPASLAYGSRGQGIIPPNASLVFDVELLAVR